MAREITFQKLLQSLLKDTKIANRSVDFFNTRWNFFNNFNRKKIINVVGHQNFIDHYSCIEFTSLDFPFILESLIDLLNTHRLPIIELIHPTYWVVRSDKRIKAIYTEPNKDENAVPESYCMFVFEDPNHKLDQLQKEVEETLQEIHSVTADFKTISKILNNYKAPKEADFTEWLLDDNFIFLGFMHDKLYKGLLKDPDNRTQVLAECNAHEKKISFYLSSISSRINKGRPVINIVYPDGAILLGMFTRKAEGDSVDRIPLLKERVLQVFNKKSNQLTSFYLKEFIYAYNLFPLAFRIALPSDLAWTFCLKISNSRIKKKPYVYFWKFPADHYGLAIIWPLNDYLDNTLKKIDQVISEKGFCARNFSSKATSSIIFLVYQLVSLEKKSLSNAEIKNFSQHIELSISRWAKRVSHSANALSLKGNWINHLVPIASRKYKELTSPEMAIEELPILYQVINGELDVKITLKKATETTLQLTFYERSPKSLSYHIPILNNFQLEIIQEDSFEFSKSQISRFFFKKPENTDIERLRTAIEWVALDKMSSESLNALVTKSSLDIHQVQLLKALVGYLYQMGCKLSRIYLKNQLQQNPLFAEQLVIRFENKFAEVASKAGYKISRRKIPKFTPNTLSLSQMKANLESTIDAIIRTNYFEKKSSIAFKVNGDLLPFRIEPAPKFEMWVYHSHFEAVHLRGGLIARGGIRWSDRQDDFRMEVMDLWRTQMLKNTVIVPVGAKGGFVVHYMPVTMENVIWSYKKIMSDFLDLTTTKVRLDSEDEYLVVAADKGTASFSDYANEISLKRNFWLGDAFASGGKDGYNHKEYGITALGAWESLRWHFYHAGKDPFQDEFTVVGIGDMGGDVFGNGMLASKKIRLIAAFNHKNIFIDPNPDSESSWKERQRLFKLTKGWDEYDKSLISKGGGVFPRQAAKINLSKEAQHALKVRCTEISGEGLVSALLKSPVDVLFNGGIGTYVKAINESQTLEIENADCRIDSNQVRAKIFVEGGNLGITQTARIEFALRGGIINTDAVDNSGGVDMSDHEVNLKIALNRLFPSEKTNSLEKRNQLLRDLGKKVSNQVLSNNFRQNLALSMQENLSDDDRVILLEGIKRLEKEGFLRRRFLDLPENLGWQWLLDSAGKLPRPLLAVIHAYTKLYVQSMSLSLPESRITQALQEYFPEEFDKKLLRKHPLAEQIAAMHWSNYVADWGGLLFWEKCRHNLGLTPDKALLAYLEIEEFLEIASFRDNKAFPHVVSRKFGSLPANQSIASLHQAEKTVYRFLEMAWLFPQGGKSWVPKKSMVKWKAKPSWFVFDWMKELPEKISNEIAERWLHVELRYLASYVLPQNHDSSSFTLWYFNHGYFDLKRILYNIVPKNSWEINLLFDLKKKFWSGIVKIFMDKKGRHEENVKEHLNQIDGEINLGTLGGFTGYWFSEK